MYSKSEFGKSGNPDGEIDFSRVHNVTLEHYHNRMKGK